MKQNTKFKQTKIGEIPEDWEMTTLGYISKSVSDTYKFSDEQVVFLNTSDIYEGKVLLSDKNDPKTLPGQAKKRIKNNDILFSEIRPANKRYAYIDFDAPQYVVSTKLMVLRALPKVLPKYLYTYLTCPKTLTDFQILAESRSGTFPQITFQEISGYPIALPPLTEQQQIVDFLFSINKKIEINKKMNKNLEEIGKALFKRWFVDFEFPNDDGMSYKSSGGEMVDSELGEIPKGWEIKTLRQLVEYYIGGGWGSEQQNENHTVEAAVVRGTDIPAIKTGSYGLLPIRFHKESNYKSRVLKESDIVFEVSGGSTDQPVGRSCLILGSLLNQYSNKPICASFCKLIRPAKDLGYLLQPSFELLYSTDEIYKYQEKSTGITNYKFEFFLDEYKLALPLNPSLITQYISFSKSLNNRVSDLSVESENLKKIRDSLLPRLMSGKLRV